MGASLCAWFVWLAEFISDGGLFFRSPVVDLLFIFRYVNVMAGSRSAKSMHLVEHRRWILWLYNAWSPLA